MRSFLYWNNSRLKPPKYFLSGQGSILSSLCRVCSL